MCGCVKQQQQGDTRSLSTNNHPLPFNRARGFPGAPFNLDLNHKDITYDLRCPMNLTFLYKKYCTKAQQKNSLFGQGYYKNRLSRNKTVQLSSANDVETSRDSSFFLFSTVVMLNEKKRHRIPKWDHNVTFSPTLKGYLGPEITSLHRALVSWRTEGVSPSQRRVSSLHLHTATQ